MALITFENKEKLVDNPEVDRKYKITADDVNEIKNVINENADSLGSLTEMVLNLKEWKLQSFAESNNRINLPNDFNEIMIVIRSNDSNSIIASTIIPKILLNETSIGVNIGGRYTAGAGIGADSNISLTSYNTTFVYVNGADVIANTKTYVYYR